MSYIDFNGNTIGYDQPPVDAGLEMELYKIIDYLEEFQRNNSVWKYSSRDSFKYINDPLKVDDIDSITDKFNEICDQIDLGKYRIENEQDAVYTRSYLMRYIKDRCKYFLCIIA